MIMRLEMGLRMKSKYAILSSTCALLAGLTTCATPQSATVAGVLPEQLAYFAASTHENHNSRYSTFTFQTVRLVAEADASHSGSCGLGDCALHRACDSAARLLLDEWAQTHTVDAYTHALGSLVGSVDDREGQQVQDCQVAFIDVPEQTLTCEAGTSVGVSQVQHDEGFAVQVEATHRGGLEDGCVKATQMLVQSLGSGTCSDVVSRARGVLVTAGQRDNRHVGVCSISLRRDVAPQNIDDDKSCDVATDRATQAYTVQVSGMSAPFMAHACDSAAQQKLAAIRRGHCADELTRATGELVGPVRGIPARGMASRCLITLADMPL